MIQGHAAIVFTLLSLFLMMVIFMTQSPRRASRADWPTVDRSAEVVDDDVHEPRAERGGLLRILRLLAVHGSTPFNQLPATSYQPPAEGWQPKAQFASSRAASCASVTTPASKLVL